MATFTSKASAVWTSTDSSAWNQAGTPATGDTVTVANGHVMTGIPSFTVSAAVSIGTGNHTFATNATWTVATNGTLSYYSVVVLPNISVTGGTFKIYPTTFNPTSLAITGGTIEVTSSTFNPVVFTHSGNWTIDAKANPTAITLPSLSANTGGTGTWTITNPLNLTLTNDSITTGHAFPNTSGAFSGGGSITTNGNLTIDVSMVHPSTITVATGKTLTINSGITFTIAAGTTPTLTLTGTATLNNLGTITHSGNGWTITGSSTSAVNNLGTFTCSNSATINSPLNLYSNATIVNTTTLGANFVCNILRRSAQLIFAGTKLVNSNQAYGFGGMK